jgi:hypothetical protein
MQHGERPGAIATGSTRCLRLSRRRDQAESSIDRPRLRAPGWTRCFSPSRPGSSNPAQARPGSTTSYKLHFPRRPEGATKKLCSGQVHTVRVRSERPSESRRLPCYSRLPICNVVRGLQSSIGGSGQIFATLCLALRASEDYAQVV